jgi:hypothetical protein
MKNQVSNARTSFIPVFSQIVKENHKKILSLDARLKKLVAELEKASGEDHINLIEGKFQLLEIELAKASLIVIVFSAMVLESYIYDYAARHLTDAYVRDHIDKLDTISKWIIVPKLITGKELPRHRKWFGSLKRLIKTRNSIIHHKSSEPPDFTGEVKKYLEKLQSNDDIILDTAKQAAQTFDLLIIEMTTLDPKEELWIKGYLR